MIKFLYLLEEALTSTTSPPTWRVSSSSYKTVVEGESSTTNYLNQILGLRLLKKNITTYKDIVMLGKVFQEGGINLVYGDSGTGKTVSAIKALNEDGIIPILLDYDDNHSPEANECEYIHIDGVKYLKDSDSTIPSGRVIIIDTWQMLLTNGGNIEAIEAIRDAGNTIVLIAHSKQLATRNDLPDIDPKYSNHFAAKLFLEYDKGNKSKTNPRPEGYNLTVMKLRGYKGKRTITNWMRHELTVKREDMTGLANMRQDLIDVYEKDSI